MNQIIAAVMLFGIVTVVFAPLIIESGSQIFAKSDSISDVMQSSRHKAGQIMVATNVQWHDGVTTVFVSNIGIEDVRIHAVLVDGAESDYALKDQDGVRVDAVKAGELGVLDVTGKGDVVQVVATSGKLFEFFILGS